MRLSLSSIVSIHSGLMFRAKSRDEKIVLAPVDRQKAVAVDVAEVACPQGFLRPAPPEVAVHDRRSVDNDLAIDERKRSVHPTPGQRYQADDRRRG